MFSNTRFFWVESKNRYLNNRKFPMFNFKHIPTKSVNDKALLHMKDEINCKLRFFNLKIEKEKEWKRIFIEIFQKTHNVIRDI